MTEQVIDGYRLVNIDIGDTAGNLFTWPLIACLDLINKSLDVFSQIFRNFRFYCLRVSRILLSLLPEPDTGEPDSRQELRSPLSVSTKDDDNVVNDARRPMNLYSHAVRQISSSYIDQDNGTRVIYPSKSSHTQSSSYILFLDTEPPNSEDVSRLPTYRAKLKNRSKPSAFRVVNIAAEVGDRKFFEIVRFLHDLKFQSLKGKLHQLFSWYEYRLGIIKIENDKDELRWSAFEGTLDMKSRDGWNDEPGMASAWVYTALLQHHLRFLPEDTQRNIEIIGHLPQWKIPLSDSELIKETQAHSIYAVAFMKQLSFARMLLYHSLIMNIGGFLIAFAMVLLQPTSEFNIAEFNITWLAWLIGIAYTVLLAHTYEIDLTDTVWGIIRDVWSEILMRVRPKGQPSPVGLIRFRFSCECGESFFYDIEQSQIDLKPLVMIMKSRPRVNIPIEAMSMSPFWISLVSKLYQGDSLDAGTGNTGHTGDSTSSATTPHNENSMDPSHKGKCRISDIGSVDITDAADSYESEQSRLDSEVEKYLIVCFPNPSGHIMWHRRLKKEIPDHELIREIRKIYIQLRPAWRRLIELRGFSNVRLAKFGVAHEREQGRVVVIPEEWDWPKNEDRNWEYTFDGNLLSVDGFSKLMIHHWVDKGRKKHNHRTEKAKADNTPRLNHQWLPEISIYRQNEVITLPSYQHTENNQIIHKVFWLQLAKAIKIHLPKDSTVSERFMQSNTKPDENDTDWFSSASIEIDLGSINSEYLLRATPKKRGERLCPDEKGKVVRIGWGIWIDEDFSVPWYVPLIVGSLSLAIFVFAVWYTSKHGPPANGWTIGSFILMNVTFMFNIWVLRTKDSKHP